MPKKIVNAKIAMIDFEVNASNQESLVVIRARESDTTIERITKILDSGANVILTTQGVDDLKCFVNAGAMAVHRYYTPPINTV